VSEQKVLKVFDLLCDAMIRDLSAESVRPEVYKEVIQFLKQMNVSSAPVPGSKVAKVALSMSPDIPFPRAV
jgi:hypothetical protein